MRHFALLGLLLAGCGPTQQTTTTAEPAPPPPLAAHVEVLQRSGGTIMPGDLVKTGADFELRLELTREAYVYVAQMTGGEASLLWPQPLQTARMPAGVHRVPAAGYWLYTDGPPGEDTLMVVAATEPLGLSAPALAAAFGEVEAPAGAAAPPVADDAVDGGIAATEGAEAVDAAPPGPAAPLQPLGDAGTAVSGTGGGATRKKPKPLLRESQSWQPRADELAAFHPRGNLRARDIKLRKDNPDIVDADAEGVVVYKLSFRHGP
jgi:hypothetical protein